MVSYLKPLALHEISKHEPEPKSSAISQDCPVCFSKWGEPCTQPTDNGRRPVRWFHYKRLEERG